MTTPLKNGAMTIQRAVILDVIKGHLFSLRRYPQTDYLNGYEDALIAVAISIGVDNELINSQSVSKLVVSQERQ